MQADIDVVQHGTTPTFVVTYDRGKKACVKGLTVTAVARGVRKEMWAVRRAYRAPDALCADHLTYGITPAGYEKVVWTGPLNHAANYEVAAMGVGWNTSKPFATP